MLTRLMLLIALCSFSRAIHAQDSMDKFVSDVCACIQKMKPETLPSISAIDEGIGNCLNTAIATHKKDLKKQNIIDWDKGATEEQAAKMWQQIFKKCNDATAAVFARKGALEDEAASGSFQGIILYAQDIEVGGSFKKMGITKDRILEDMKKKGSWADSLYSFHRLGNYARIGNNEEQSQKIYIADENTIYSFNAIGDGICSVQEAIDLDLTGAPDKPTVIELDSTATIMGMTCKIMRMKWKISQIDYYYNQSQAQVNPELFSKHSSEGFAEFLKRTKCLPLQIVSNAIGMTVIQTAIGIKPGKFDSTIMAVPELVEDESLNVMKLPGIKMMRIKE